MTVKTVYCIGLDDDVPEYLEEAYRRERWTGRGHKKIQAPTR